MSKTIGDDLELLQSLPSEARPAGQWWPMRVEGDLMAPIFNRGDVVFVVPAHCYDGPGKYVLDDEGSFTITRLETGARGTVTEVPENPLYSSRDISRAWLETHIVGQVVAVMKPV